MKLNLITLATVKTHLGISGSDNDAAITAMIPIVSADIRKIMCHDYADYTWATITNGSAVIDSDRVLMMGDVLEGTGITDDTYVISYDEDNAEYTMSANATADSDYFNRTVNIRQWPTISKMIWYRISGQSTSDANKKNVASKSYGPVSITYSQSEINKKWNYPQVLIDDLGSPYASVY